MAILYWSSVSTQSFTTSGNWKTAAGVNGTPASNDTLIFSKAGTQNLTTDLDQSALTGITLVIEPTYDGEIGAISSAGVVSWFKIDATSILCKRGRGARQTGGPALALIDTGDAACEVIVETSRDISSDELNPALQVKGDNLTIRCGGGQVAVAPRRGETATVYAVTASNNESGIAPFVYIGPGVTPHAADCTMHVAGGTILNESESATAVTTVTVTGEGEYLYRGTCPHTTVNVDGGKCEYSGIGTCTNMHAASTLDCSKDQRNKTFTNFYVYSGFDVNLDNGKPGSIVPVVQYYHCSPLDGSIRWPDHLKATLATI